MKKLATILLALFLLAGILAACNQTAETAVIAAPEPVEVSELVEETTEPEYDPEPEPEEEHGFSGDSSFELKISLASDTLLDSFDYLHEVDYTLLREAHAGGTVERSNGDRLVIWADVPLYDFALISITDDFVDDEIVFIPAGTFGKVEELLPGQAFVINSYAGGGTLPTSGISFVSGSGERHYLWMQADQSVNMYPNPFSDPDFLDLFEDGSLQIEIRRDGREGRYITVTLDEIGDTDPIDWFIENQHLWYLFFMLEFENSEN